MSKVSFGQAYEERILPHLLQDDSEELWLTGRDGSCTVHPELAAALLRDLVLPTSAIVVPDAPVSALKEVAQFLHLGRYFVIREGVKKKPNLFGTLSQTMGRWVQVQVKSPKLFSENIHSVIFTANIQKCPKTCNT